MRVRQLLGVLVEVAVAAGGLHAPQRAQRSFNDRRLGVTQAPSKALDDAAEVGWRRPSRLHRDEHQRHDGRRMRAHRRHLVREPPPHKSQRHGPRATRHPDVLNHQVDGGWPHGIRCHASHHFRQRVRDHDGRGRAALAQDVDEQVEASFGCACVEPPARRVLAAVAQLQLHGVRHGARQLA